MRILLVAYEFPPSPSPQSLRWAYLVRELVRAGHDVQVLTTAEPPWKVDGLPDIPARVEVHRVIGGPIAGMSAMLARRQEAKLRRQGGGTARIPSPAPGATLRAAVGGASAAVVAATSPQGGQALNWKGRLVERLKRLAASRLFPDAGGEWVYPARRALDRLVREVRPDVVVSSHEPPTTLELCIAMKRRVRVPWLADLGDPVLADYTPARWRRRSLRIERRVMRLADAITVTTPGTRQLLLDRHGPAAVAAGIEVLTQGFDDRRGETPATLAGCFDGGLVELLYTGSFYRFRRPDMLIDAVLAVPGTRLNVAAASIPDWLRPRFEAHPERFRLLGYLAHVVVLDLQRQADVLVNIANDNPCQVPGKFYEYLGAGRPILHLGVAADDVAASLVRERRRGWVCGDAGAIEARLRTLAERKRAGLGDPDDVDLDVRAVAEFGWSRQAGKLATLLDRLVVPGRTPPPVQAGQED